MKDSFVIYTKYEEQINILSDAQAGVLLRALIKYQNGAELPKMDGITTMAFSFIKQQIEFDNKKYDEVCKVNKENGQRGGRPTKAIENKGEKPKKPSGFKIEEEKPSGFSKNRTKPKKPESDTDKDTDIYSPPLSPHSGERGGFQEKFFSVYCQFKKFAGGNYPQIDFEKLLKEFEKSSALRKKFSWQVILDSYDSIIAGNFRDKVDAQAEGREYMADRERYYTALRDEEERKVEAVVKKLMTYPRYAEIDKRLRSIEIDSAKAELKGDKPKMAKFEMERQRLRMERNNILSNNGLEEEDITIKRHCHECNDTGWLEDGTLCSCYKGG